MNDNQPWPRIGRAGNSHVVRVLARAAGWHLAEMPADLGLPLAGCLYNEANWLLVAVTDGALAPSVAAMDQSLIATRSDALIACVGQEGILPEVALGLWRSGRATWHWPLLPWAAPDGAIWLVYGPDGRGAASRAAFKLIPRHLRGDFIPWASVSEQDAGFVRSAVLLAERDVPGGEDAPIGKSTR
jgi:hypothetical protein